MRIEEIDTHLNSGTSEIESVTVKLKNSSIVLTLIYRHPKGNFDSLIEYLEALFNQKVHIKEGNSAIMCGDLNVDTLKKDRKALRYLDVIKSFGYTFYVTEPTRSTLYSDTCIDHVFGNLSTYQSVITQVKDLHISDHHSIEIEVINQPKDVHENHIHIRTHSPFQLDQFQKQVQDISWNEHLCSTNDVN